MTMGQICCTNQNLIKIDGTYEHNTRIPLTFTYGTVHNSICNNYIYNGCSSANREIALSGFKDTLKEYAVAGGLNRKLILHLMFHSKEYK